MKHDKKKYLKKTVVVTASTMLAVNSVLASPLLLNVSAAEETRVTQRITKESKIDNFVKVTAKSEGPGTPIGNSLDGNTDTFTDSDYNNYGEGQPGALPQVYTFELSEVKQLSKVRIHPRKLNTNGRVASYKIKVSNDGATYTTVLEGTLDPNSETWHDILLNAPVSAKFVQLELRPTDENFAQVHVVTTAEVELYETITVEEADKSELESLYNQSKDFQPHFNQSQDYFDYFQGKLVEAKTVLDNPSATQEEVNSKVRGLTQAYYIVLNLEFYYKYGISVKDGSFTNPYINYSEYLTSDLRSVMQVRYESAKHLNSNYGNNTLRPEENQNLINWYNQFVEADKNLKKADSTNLYGKMVGLNPDAADATARGTFEVSEEKEVVEDGKKKIQLHVVFKNDAKHPITNTIRDKDNKGNKYEKWKSGDLENFSISMDGESYTGETDPRGSISVDDTNAYDGVEFDVVVEPGIYRFKLQKGSSVRSATPGYYHTNLIQEEEEGTVSSLINGEKVSGDSLESMIESSGIKVNEVTSLELTKGTVTQDDLAYLQELSYLEDFTMNLSDTLKLEAKDGSFTTVLGEGKNQAQIIFAPNRSLASKGDIVNVRMEGITEVHENGIDGGSIEELYLPDVVTVGDNAFSTVFPWLERLALNNAKTVGVNAFNGCKRLTDLTLEQVEILKEGSFKYTDALKELTLPATLKTIEKIGFGIVSSGNKNGTKITLLSETPPKVAVGAFKGVGGTNTPVFIIPKGSMEAYCGKSSDAFMKRTDINWNDLHLRESGSYYIEYRDTKNMPARYFVAFVPEGEAIGEARLPEPTETVEGKVFKEWNTKKDGSGDTITAETVLTKETTAYPIFVEKTEVVNAKINGVDASGASILEMITSADLTSKDVESIEFVNHAITMDDLAYINSLSSLKNLTMNLGENVSFLGEDGEPTTILPVEAFKGNHDIETLSIAGFTEIGKSAFENTYIENFNMPDVKVIGTRAFKSNRAETLDLPNVTVIGIDAFNGNENIETINMPKVERIENSAFYCASNFEEFTLPATIKFIGTDAFDAAASGSRELNVTIETATPPEVEDGAFATGTITVPEGSLPNYLSSLDLTKTFMTSGSSKWKNLTVQDSTYHHITFYYQDGGTAKSYGYIKDGEALNSVTVIQLKIPEGKVFKEWNTKKDGSGEAIVADAVITEDLTVYAIFEEVVLADKSKLKDLYDEASAFEPEALGQSTTINNLNDELEKAKAILEDVTVKQEVVDAAYETLNDAYLKVQIEDLSTKYDASRFDYTPYTTESAKTLAYNADRYKSLGSDVVLEEVLKSFEDAIANLEEYDGSAGTLYGIKYEALAAWYRGGHFDIEENTILDKYGNRVLQLKIAFHNTGIDEIREKEALFGKYSAKQLQEGGFAIEYINEEGTTTWVPFENSYFRALDGSFENGITINVTEIPANAEIIEMEISGKGTDGHETYLPGRYRTGKLASWDTILENLITKAEALNELDYTNKSWDAADIASKISDAKWALENNRDDLYEDYAKALNDAINSLVKCDDVDYDAMEAIVKEGEAFENDKYTVESWRPYRAAISQGREIVGKKSQGIVTVKPLRVTQEEFDAVLEAIETNKAKLVDATNMRSVEFGSVGQISKAKNGGIFTVISEEVVGKVVRLTVQFDNNGLWPEDAYTKLSDFSDDDMNEDLYIFVKNHDDETIATIDNEDLIALEGEDDKEKGVTFTVDVPVGEYYFETAGISGANQSVRSTGFYRTDDKIAPEVEVSYATNETKDSVTVTLKANEAIKAVDGWEQVNETTLEKVYTENKTETITVVDLADNETEVVVTVDSIVEKVQVTFKDRKGNELESFEVEKGKGLTLDQIPVVEDEFDDNHLEYLFRGWIGPNESTGISAEALIKKYAKLDSDIEFKADMVNTNNIAVVKVTYSGGIYSIESSDLPSPDYWGTQFFTLPGRSFTLGDGSAIKDNGKTFTGASFMYWESVIGGWTNKNPGDTIVIKNTPKIMTITPVLGQNFTYDTGTEQKQTKYPVNNKTYVEKDWLPVLTDTEDAKFLGWEINGKLYETREAVEEAKIPFKLETKATAVWEESDKTAPEVKVTYSNNNGSQVTADDVVVTLTANEAIKDLEGWTRVADNVLTKTFDKNGKHTVTVSDLAGNTTNVKFEVKRIDKTAPVITGVEDGVYYASDVTYGIKEQSIAKIYVDGVAYDEKKAPRTISAEGKHTIRVVDKAGNEASVSFVIDKTASEVKVTYSNNNGNQVTADDVVVTLTANEAIKDLEGWTRVADNVLTKTFDKNGKHTVTVSDLAGNTTNVKFEVKRIDKIAPVITGVEDGAYYASDVTYGIKEQSIRKIYVDGVAYDEKKAPRTISAEGKHTIRVVDKAGNEASVSFVIDKTKPVVKVRDENGNAVGSQYTMTLTVGDEYFEFGALVNDNLAGEVVLDEPTNINYVGADGKVVAVDAVDTSKVGEYRLGYLFTDNAGNKQMARRIVKIVAKEEPAPPVEPETPVEPQEPVKPETPEVPLDPQEPSDPETPDTPTPQEPNVPADPSVPQEPGVEVDPINPIVPETPTVPQTPNAPAVVVTPVQPRLPIAVVDPQEEVDPVEDPEVEPEDIEDPDTPQGGGEDIDDQETPLAKNDGISMEALLYSGLGLLLLVAIIVGAYEINKKRKAGSN